MAFKTEEVALKILEALRAEVMHEPKEITMRKPLGPLAKDLMEKYGWRELDFLQAWGFIMKNRYVKGEQLHGGYYAQPSEAGWEFIKEHYPGMYPEIDYRGRFYKVFFPAVLIICWVLRWVLMR